VSPVLACPVGVMVLRIVVLPPGLVSLLDLWPSACVGERVVSESPLDREQRFCIILPRLTGVNAFFTDTEQVVKLHCLVAVKDSSTVCDERFWRAVTPQGLGQNCQVVPLILRWGDGGSEDHSGKVLKNRNRIDWLGIWEQMLFDIPDIAAPKLMAACRLERHFKLGARLTWWLFNAVELSVRRHDATTGGWTYLDSHAQECCVDAILAKQRILLELADLVSDGERCFARPLSRLGLGF